MNFGSHIWVAALLQRRSESGFPDANPLGVNLGSALPDFSAMARTRRIRPSESQSVNRGVQIHHLTDEVFHHHPDFLQWQRQLAATLPSDLSRGARRAIAHLGPELLLDAGLLRHLPAADEIATTIGAIASNERSLVTTVDSSDEAALRMLLRRITTWSGPDGSSADIAERLFRTLQHRPRLSFRSNQRGIVASAIEVVRADVLASAPAHCRAIERLVWETWTTRSTPPNEDVHQQHGRSP